MKNYIKDIFGNSIEVFDINQAINQTNQFIEYSKSKKIIFKEFKFKNSLDQFKKPFKYAIEVKNGKEVTNLEYYLYQRNKLLKL